MPGGRRRRASAVARDLEAAGELRIDARGASGIALPIVEDRSVGLRGQGKGRGGVGLRVVGGELDQLSGAPRPEEMGDVELALGRLAPDAAAQRRGVLLR